MRTQSAITMDWHKCISGDSADLWTPLRLCLQLYHYNSLLCAAETKDPTGRKHGVCTVREELASGDRIVSSIHR